MRYIENTEGLRLTQTAVTIGKFDGLHMGHRLLLEKLACLKAERGLTTVMVAFDFQPGTVLKGQQIRTIYSPEQEKKVLESEGPDVVIRYPFTRELAAMEPEEFVRKVLREQLDARALVVGDDFRFGKDRAGDAARLTELGRTYGYDTFVIPRLKIDGQTVSSTLIREMLDRGDKEHAEELLGRRLD